MGWVGARRVSGEPGGRSLTVHFRRDPRPSGRERKGNGKDDRRSLTRFAHSCCSDVRSGVNLASFSYLFTRLPSFTLLVGSLRSPSHLVHSVSRTGPFGPGETEEVRREGTGVPRRHSVSHPQTRPIYPRHPSLRSLLSPFAPSVARGGEPDR